MGADFCAMGLHPLIAHLLSRIRGIPNYLDGSSFRAARWHALGPQGRNGLHYIGEKFPDCIDNDPI